MKSRIEPHDSPRLHGGRGLALPPLAHCDPSVLGGGAHVRDAGRPKRALPALKIPARDPAMLSFVNLVEAHVLASITRDYDVPLQTVRRAVRYLQREFESDHPLIERVLETDRRDLFIREAGKTRECVPGWAGGDPGKSWICI